MSFDCAVDFPAMSADEVLIIDCQMVSLRRASSGLSAWRLRWTSRHTVVSSFLLLEISKFGAASGRSLRDEEQCKRA